MGDNARLGPMVVTSEWNPTPRLLASRRCKKGRKIRQSFELIILASPVSQEFCRIRNELEQLKKVLMKYENRLNDMRGDLKSPPDCDDDDSNQQA